MAEDNGAIRFRMRPGKTLKEVAELTAQRGENVFHLSGTNRICKWYRYKPEGINRNRSGRFGVLQRDDGEIVMECITSTKKPNERDLSELFYRTLYLGYLLGKLDAITIEGEQRMAYSGGGMYHAEPCPLCGQTLWNGRCENPDCHHHWHPKEDEEDEDDT